MYVLSFYDVTGNAVRPWAEAGYHCVCFDIQNKGKFERFSNGGWIHYRHADLYSDETWHELDREFSPHRAIVVNDVALVLGFPVCTDLAVSGAKHWESKRKANPNFQSEAVGHAKRIAQFANACDAPFAIENPVGAMSTLWRKPNFYFHPFEYGGYIPHEDAIHPDYPAYIAPRDAYPKKTGIWSGNGFVQPEKRPVDCPSGYSTQHLKLGGKSDKTKNIRSATPRGFARAVFEANGFPFINKEVI